MFSTVVVGADDSSTARQAVVIAADVAQTGGGALHIVTAYDPKSVHAEELPDELRYSAGEHPAEALLRRLSELVRERGLEPIVHAAEGDPVDAIVAVAESVDADLIVVGNKGMKGVRRVLGSVPNSVAHKAPCSVLIADTTSAA
ncbi:MAG: universal stress protein [Solirubrobacteraceae bacterium]